MEIKLHYEILDTARKRLLPSLKHFKANFYLAGGTALALLIGHRDSVDFDYFTAQDFDSIKLYQECEKIFSEHKIEMTQNSKNTLSIILNNRIKLSFFALPDQPVLPLIETDYFRIVPEKELAVMKITALLRGTYRDYVDLYYLLQKYSLQEIMELASLKYRNFDEGIYLKCLLSYQDVEITPIKFKNGFAVSTKKVFTFIEKITSTYLKTL